MHREGFVDLFSGGGETCARRRCFDGARHSLLHTADSAPAAFFGIEGILYAAPAADMLAMLVSGVLMIDYFRRLRNDAPAIALE